MSQQKLLATVVPVLESAGIPYMITGSIASSMQGEPRSTHDIDLVAVIPSNAIGLLLLAFPAPDFLLQEDAIREAVRHRSMFNLLSLTDGEKVDFWMLTDDPFDQSRFARRQSAQIGNLSVVVSAPEDTILAKLRWAKLSGGSEKQFNDVLHVYQVQGEALDLEYLSQWAKTLDVEELWERVQATATTKGDS